MKSAIPFLVKKTHQLLDRIDEWSLKKIEENKQREREENESKKAKPK